jgi:integrase
VPLSHQARRLVAELLDQLDETEEYLFPSPAAKRRRRTGARPPVMHPAIAAHALAVAMARFVANLDAKTGRTWRHDRPTPHDLRRTVATRLAELGIPKEDRDAVLNHTPRDVGKIHYDLYDREREKRQALDR